MTEVERAEQIASGPRRRFWQNIAMVSALVLALAGLFVALYQLSHRAETAETSLVSLGEQVQQRCDIEGSLMVGDRDLCEQADDVVEDPTTEVVPVAVGPTAAQMDAALDRYCLTRDCTPGPTDAQVSEALADLCSEIRCRGADGKDSTAPGPPPTEAQMDAAQERYCDAHDECRGATGAIGATGRGIQSMQCATGGWVITYTDGLTEPDGGPCRGPQGVHGEQGPSGADSTVPGPEGPRGPQGTARPGDYACPDGEVVTGLKIAEDGAVTLSCKDTTPPVIETP